jgi:hypothetical protein
MPSLKKSDLQKNIEKNFEDKVDYNAFKKSELVSVGTRISPEDRDVLERHFHDLGLNLSQGLRMIVKEFLKNLA